ncbi:MAG: DUF1559 domain-containing protein [Lentisphaeria bacterium]|nr:DUF1559 domain-containing protein [Lentisphaeria bacterium]NQZ68365.1 DUF1559 domain-containing protein [Lentisphaeria bacterium]
MDKKKKFTLGEVVVIVLVVSVLIALIIPLGLQISKSREHARRINCNSNLKSIALALLMYSGDANGYFPITPNGNNFEPLNTLEIINDSKVFGCPSVARSSSISRNADYRYGASGLLDDNEFAKMTTLGSDRSGNHPRNSWINAMFIDGHVEGSKPDGKRSWNSF